MKYLLIVACFIFSSACRKNTTDNQDSIVGAWTMVSVTLHPSQQILDRPSAPDMVVVSFNGSTWNGSLSGNTHVNTIFPSAYTISDDQALSIPALSRTKVSDSQWGNLFMNNITLATGYEISSNGSLQIFTPAATLHFTREK